MAGARTTVILGGLHIQSGRKTKHMAWCECLYLSTYLRMLIPEAKADHLGPFGG